MTAKSWPTRGFAGFVAEMASFAGLGISATVNAADVTVSWGLFSSVNFSVNVPALSILRSEKLAAPFSVVTGPMRPELRLRVPLPDAISTLTLANAAVGVFP